MSYPHFQREIYCGDTDISEQLILCGREYDLEGLDPDGSNKAPLKSGAKEKLTLSDRSYEKKQSRYISCNKLVEMKDGTIYSYQHGPVRVIMKLFFRLVSSVEAGRLRRFYRKLMGDLIPLWFTDIDGVCTRVRIISGLPTDSRIGSRYDMTITIRSEE